MLKERYTMTCAVIVSMVFLGGVGNGCKKRQSPPLPTAAPELARVVTNRMNDVAYKAALNQNRLKQGKQASELFDLRQQMRACRERVKAGLPANASDAALKDALSKDSEWRAFELREKSLVDADKQTRAAARDMIRARIEEEGKAVEAVAQGRAQAVDAQVPRK